MQISVALRLLISFALVSNLFTYAFPLVIVAIFTWNKIQDTMNEIWPLIAGAVASIITGFASWFYTKKKYYTEVDSNLISNMQASLDFYKSLADDNKQRLDDVLLENVKLRKEVSDISKENATLKQEVRELRDMVDKLTMKLANYGLNRLLEDAEAPRQGAKAAKDIEKGYERKETNPNKQSTKADKSGKA